MPALFLHAQAKQQTDRQRNPVMRGRRQPKCLMLHGLLLSMHPPVSKEGRQGQVCKVTLITQVLSAHVSASRRVGVSTPTRSRASPWSSRCICGVFCLAGLLFTL